MKTDIIISELKKGDKLYSTTYGEVEFIEIVNSDFYIIKTLDNYNMSRTFSREGKYLEEHPNVTLFKVSPFKEVERVVLVRENDFGDYKPRVLIAIKNNRAVCWSDYETSANVNIQISAISWKYWKEVEKAPEIVELTFQDISDGKGVGIDPKLIKIIL